MEFRTEWDRDEQKASEGSLVELRAGVFVKVLPLNSPRFRNRYAVLTKPHRRAIDRGDEAAFELDRKLQIEAMAETVLVGWGTAVDGNGKPDHEADTVAPYLFDVDGNKIEFNRDNAVAMLRKDEFFRDVTEAAASFEAFRRDQHEDSVGNSSRSSPGGSSSEKISSFSKPQSRSAG